MYFIIGANGQQYGPVSQAELIAWIRDQRANGETLAKTDAMPEWQPLRNFPEFAQVFAPAMDAQTSQVSGAIPKYDDYLVPAILTTLCCCPPFGGIAIYFAAKANTRSAAGDHSGASKSAAKAKFWTWVSLATGALWQIGTSLALYYVASW